MSPAPSQSAASGANPQAVRRASSSHVHTHFPFGSGNTAQGSADFPQKTSSQYIHNHFPFSSADSVTQPSPSAAKPTPPKVHVHNHLPFGSFVKPKPPQQAQPPQPDPALIAEARKLREELIESRHEPDLPVKPGGIPVTNVSIPPSRLPPLEDDLPDPTPLQAKTKSKRSIASLSLSSLLSSSGNVASKDPADRALEEYRRLKQTSLQHRSQELYAPELVPEPGTGLRTISKEGIDRPSGSKCFESDSDEDETDTTTDTSA